MIKSVLCAAMAAVLVAAPVQAQTSVGDIVGGIARQYLGQEQDRAAFAQAQSVNTLSAYQSYLKQFPKGAYVSQARDQVRRLGGKVAVPGGQSGEGASLSTQQRINVQRRLTALGYNTSGTDGSFGPGTRRAIGLWQRDRNYKQTGTLTAAQTTELLKGTAAGSASTGGSQSGTLAGAAQVEAGLRLTPQQRSLVQIGLTQRGFDTRGADGIFGQGTRNAIAGWQRANDMNATGYLTAAQAQRLMSR